MIQGAKMTAPARWRLLNEAEPSAGRGALAMEAYEVLLVSFDSVPIQRLAYVV